MSFLQQNSLVCCVFRANTHSSFDVRSLCLFPDVSTPTRSLQHCLPLLPARFPYGSIQNLLAPLFKGPPPLSIPLRVSSRPPSPPGPHTPISQPGPGGEKPQPLPRSRRSRGSSGRAGGSSCFAPTPPAEDRQRDARGEPLPPFRLLPGSRCGFCRRFRGAATAGHPRGGSQPPLAGSEKWQGGKVRLVFPARGPRQRRNEQLVFRYYFFIIILFGNLIQKHWSIINISIVIKNI